MALVTTVDELAEGLATVAQVFMWAKIQGTHDAAETEQATLLGVLGLTSTSAVHELAIISETDFVAALSGWRIGGGDAPPVANPAQRVRASLAHRAARIKVGLLKPVRDLEADAARHAAHTVADTVQKQAVATGTSSAADRKVKLSEILSQTEDTEVKIISETELKAFYGRYEVVFGSGVVPPVGKECSIEQLSGDR